MVGGTVAYNVIATLTGTTRPDDWYIVGGHYDSISEAPLTAAPGAEDNASGCAGVLELARVLTAAPPEGTVLFICYAGEEQGLLGSEDHVADLLASGNASKVQAMLDLDMIAYTADGDLDCLLERGLRQFLVDLPADAAAHSAAHRDLAGGLGLRSRALPRRGHPGAARDRERLVGVPLLPHHERPPVSSLGHDGRGDPEDERGGHGRAGGFPHEPRLRTARVGDLTRGLRAAELTAAGWPGRHRRTEAAARPESGRGEVE
jgi:Zn-dependent M28 family amino/carboxypeptidase